MPATSLGPQRSSNLPAKIMATVKTAISPPKITWVCAVLSPCEFLSAGTKLVQAYRPPKHTWITTDANRMPYLILGASMGFGLPPRGTEQTVHNSQAHSILGNRLEHDDVQRECVEPT